MKLFIRDVIFLERYFSEHLYTKQLRTVKKITLMMIISFFHMLINPMQVNMSKFYKHLYILAFTNVLQNKTVKVT
jgi:hypothetical protein